VTSKELFGVGKNAVSILYGNGSRTFRAELRNDLVFEPTRVVAGDFDHDGRDELAMGVAQPYYYQGVAVLRSNTDGTLGAPTFYSNTSTVTYAKKVDDLRVFDVNSDGHLDLVFGKYDDGGLYRLFGQGNGAFTVDPPLSSFGQGPIELGDFNGDGRIDIALATAPFASTKRLDILLAQPDGSYTRVLYDGWANGEKANFAAGDVNGDGKTDLLLTGKLLLAVCR